MKSPVLLLLLTLVLAPLPLAAQHGGAAAPATSPPAQAREFDFLIGQWEIELTPKVGGLAAMIHGAPRLLGTWKAWRAFDGFGIVDELRVIDASGNPMSLADTRRIYDAASSRWLIGGLDVYRAKFSQGNGNFKDGEMHINGSGVDREGKAYRSRTRFSEITDEGFRMQQDRSTDGGTTWDEAVVLIVAKRVSKVAAR